MGKLTTKGHLVIDERIWNDEVKVSSEQVKLSML